MLENREMDHFLTLESYPRNDIGRPYTQITSEYPQGSKYADNID